MKIAIYPGSFNPFHKGHAEVVWKATEVFDYIYIAIGINPDKKDQGNAAQIKDGLMLAYGQNYHRENKSNGGLLNGIDLQINTYTGLLKDHIQTYIERPDAIIKGLRDPQDFLYEQKMLYHNEDLGITIPTYYVIADRNLVHISSSAIRSLEKFKK